MLWLRTLDGLIVVSGYLGQGIKLDHWIESLWHKTKYLLFFLMLQTYFLSRCYLLIKSDKVVVKKNTRSYFLLKTRFTTKKSFRREKIVAFLGWFWRIQTDTSWLLFEYIHISFSLVKLFPPLRPNPPPKTNCSKHNSNVYNDDIKCMIMEQEEVQNKILHKTSQSLPLPTPSSQPHPSTHWNYTQE